jgi:Zn-dependent peptidase ImmA (M78 family)
MRKILTVCVLALVITALSLSLALAQGDQEVINEVFTETESVRGLQADPGIQVNYLNREQLEQRMLEDFAEENPEEEIDDAERIMVMLGFIEPDLDLEDFYIALLTEQVAGFYDPEDDGLYLISENQSMSAMDQYTLSHEFVHYLQDQNFDLMRPPFHDPDDVEEETDDDASFAATCLVEGDAVLASENWLTKYMDPEDMLDMQMDSGDYSTEVLDSAPPYIYESLLFPYMEGAEFVREVYDEGGWDAINRAYSEPPSTTEQI